MVHEKRRPWMNHAGLTLIFLSTSFLLWLNGRSNQTFLKKCTNETYFSEWELTLWCALDQNKLFNGCWSILYTVKCASIYPLNRAGKRWPDWSGMSRQRSEIHTVSYRQFDKINRYSHRSFHVGIADWRPGPFKNQFTALASPTESLMCLKPNATSQVEGVSPACA